MGLLDVIYASAATLKPVSPPVGVYSHMVRETETTLVMKESLLSISGDDFRIVDAATDKTVLKCSGSMFTFHDRKKIYDAEGTMLYNMAEKKLSIGRAFCVEDSKGRDVLTIKKKMSPITVMLFGSKLVASFREDGEEREIALSGDFWGGSANIKDSNGTRLAHVSRQMVNANEVVGDQQTYYVTVAPGVDLALIACAFDETKNENQDEEEEEERDVAL